jgi:diadenosine tetraphosphate (Ap4A) HIT family hydrolase
MVIQGEKMETKVYEDEYFVVVSPEYPLNCREDSDHLIMGKRTPVTDRSDMTYKEAIDFMRVSIMVGKAMYQF